MSQNQIAIVGMGCRFPGANNPAEFWADILACHSHFEEIPAERWDAHEFYSSNRRGHDTTYSRKAALLADARSFAARHFGISKRRADQMDPQQRLMLEVTREAIQDAGLEGRDYNRQKTGVFLGVSISEYASLMAVGPRVRQLARGQFGEPVDEGPFGPGLVRRRAVNAYTLPGTILSMSASCVAQAFDLGGPAIVVDAACAASTAALIQGVHYLRGLGQTREGDASPVVIAGGVHLMLAPDLMVCFAKLGALAEEQCRPFDAAADGFILGEGVGALVLKRLEDAQRDGDRVYAVIRGVAWNNDGAAPSPTTPSQAGQVRVIRAGLDDAGAEPSQIEYIECHGTGTTVGDPVEMAALGEIWKETSHSPRLGSVKANIGHALGASGVAGVMRAALAIHHGELPPQAGWDEWHPTLLEHSAHFSMETEAARWEGSRWATVSSFAFGGTNCFAVLSQPPELGEAPSVPNEPLPFYLSAPDAGLLLNYTEALRAHLQDASPDELAAAAYALATRNQEAYSATMLVRPQDGIVEAFDKAIERLAQDPPLSPLELDQTIMLGPAAGEIPAAAHFRLRQAAQAATPVERQALIPPDSRRLVSLPFVPLKRQRYWFLKD